MALRRRHGKDSSPTQSNGPAIRSNHSDRSTLIYDNEDHPSINRTSKCSESSGTQCGFQGFVGDVLHAHGGQSRVLPSKGLKRFTSTTFTFELIFPVRCYCVD